MGGHWDMGGHRDVVAEGHGDTRTWGHWDMGGKAGTWGDTRTWGHRDMEGQGALGT